MCVPVLKCHQLQGALPSDSPPGALPPGPPLGAPPPDPLLQARAPVLAILRAKPTLVLFSTAGTDKVMINEEAIYQVYIPLTLPLP